MALQNTKTKLPPYYLIVACDIARIYAGATAFSPEEVEGRGRLDSTIPALVIPTWIRSVWQSRVNPDMALIELGMQAMIATATAKEELITALSVGDPLPLVRRGKDTMLSNDAFYGVPLTTDDEWRAQFNRPSVTSQGWKASLWMLVPMIEVAQRELAHVCKSDEATVSFPRRKMQVTRLTNEPRLASARDSCEQNAGYLKEDIFVKTPRALDHLNRKKHFDSFLTQHEPPRRRRGISL
jgi:hypothetical protein